MLHNAGQFSPPLYPIGISLPPDSHPTLPRESPHLHTLEFFLLVSIDRGRKRMRGGGCQKVNLELHPGCVWTRDFQHNEELRSTACHCDKHSSKASWSPTASTILLLFPQIVFSTVCEAESQQVIPAGGREQRAVSSIKTECLLL